MIFSTLYTTLPHNLITEQFNELMEWTLIGKVPSILHVTEEMLFFTSEKHRNYTLWSCQKVCETLTFLLDNICIRFRTKLFRKIVGIPIGTNCSPLLGDFFFFFFFFFFVVLFFCCFFFFVFFFCFVMKDTS